jgi:hypothetical protein
VTEPGRVLSVESVQAAGRRRRVRVLATLTLLAAAVLLAFGAWLYWLDTGPQPVVETTLERGRLLRLVQGPGWQNLPFRLDPDEETVIAACERLANAVRSLSNGQSAFDREDTRLKLEALLANRPGLFHAESMLALWHRRRGDTAAAADHAERAERLAPVVLVQRFDREDGTPLVGGRIQSMQVECNRVVNGSLDPSLKLTFFDLTTDDEGSVRLPVYRTVYRLSSIAHPAGYDLDLPRLGWFESRGKVGLLPDATVRPKR